MRHDVDERIDHFLGETMRAIRESRSFGDVTPTLSYVGRLQVVVNALLEYERQLRRIAEKRPAELEALLSETAFRRFLESRAGSRWDGEITLGRKIGAPELDATGRPIQQPGVEEEGEQEDYANFRELARWNPRLFESVLGELGRNATRQQKRYVDALQVICTEYPQPSHGAVANRLGIQSPGALRVGLRRLRQKAKEAVLRHAQGPPKATLGDVDLAQLRGLWRERRVAELEAKLEELREAHADEPEWRILAGNAAFVGGRIVEAVLHFVFGSLTARETRTRAMFYSNLGCVEHATGNSGQAHQNWIAADELDPRSPFPRLNLLIIFVDSNVSFLWTHCLEKLGRLRKDAEHRSVIDAFLAGCPRLAKISHTVPWTQGPAKWIAESGAERSTFLGDASSEYGGLRARRGGHAITEGAKHPRPRGPRSRFRCFSRRIASRAQMHGSPRRAMLGSHGRLESA